MNAEDYGYESTTLSDGQPPSAMEELCRWRLWDRTGGGLMAELGSHQLDAASIFISALRQDGKKAHPLSVHAVGGRHIFPRRSRLLRSCVLHVRIPRAGLRAARTARLLRVTPIRSPGYDATKGIPSLRR